jgi:glucose-6-phosphate 1-dehydrogenase
MGTTRSDAFVFFGSTGDLAHKQIFPALYALAEDGRLEMPIVAPGRRNQSAEGLRARAKKSLVASGVSVDDATFDAFARRLSWVEVDFDAPETFSRIREAIGGAKHPLHYVALPPELFETVAANLAKVGLMKDARLVLEKPFGHDVASAEALSKALYEFLPEEAIFRIDHFLGKEPVENLDYFRAANSVIEQSLNAEQVESVQITMAETFGVEGRGKFYDAEGALRDVVQNHVLQIAACLAMDLPAKRDRTALREARARLLTHVRALSPSDVIRGQVRGYTEEEGVAKDSKTETFVAVKLAIDSARWEGVPFYLRAGKSLPVTATEAVIRWKGPSAPVLEDTRSPAPNHLRFRISPDVAIAFGVQVKADGEAMQGEATELVAHRAEANAMAAYERLLGDAINGDPALFMPKVGVEQSWRIVEPVLGARAPRAFSYEPGTWGPAEAERLAPPGGWYDPG